MDVAPSYARVVEPKTSEKKQGDFFAPSPTSPPINTPNNATSLHCTLVEINSIIFSPLTLQKIVVFIQRGLSSTSIAFHIMLENTSVLKIINTPSHPLVIETHNVVKHESTRSPCICFIQLSIWCCPGSHKFDPNMEMLFQLRSQRTMGVI